MVERIWSYAWASPNTAIGLALGLVALLFRAQLQSRHGALEFFGGRLGTLFAAPRLACPFRAMTLGHVILATDAGTLDCVRAHEHVHVRQYECFGPFFLPLYFASSLWQWLRGRDPYFDNHFERQAFREAG